MVGPPTIWNRRCRGGFLGFADNNRYAVASGAVASVAVIWGAGASGSSSPRLRARNADTFARFMHRSEQYRRVLLVLALMNPPLQPAAWKTPNRSRPRSVSRTARPIAAPAAYLSATDPLSV